MLQSPALPSGPPRGAMRRSASLPAIHWIARGTLLATMDEGEEGREDVMSKEEVKTEANNKTGEICSAEEDIYSSDSENEEMDYVASEDEINELEAESDEDMKMELAIQEVNNMSQDEKDIMTDYFGELSDEELENLEDEAFMMFEVLLSNVEQPSNLDATLHLTSEQILQQLDDDEGNGNTSDLDSSTASLDLQDRLWSHITEHRLGLAFRPPTRDDGNCWYDAVSDQILVHGLPDLPTDHAALRRAVVAAIPSLPQADLWRDFVFGSEEKMAAFLGTHARPGEWTDEDGIMCQATALLVGRQIRLVGTANIGQPGPGYTTLESCPGSEEQEPLTVGYYQEVHFQSLVREGLGEDSGVVAGCGEEAGLARLLGLPRGIEVRRVEGRKEGPVRRLLRHG